MGEKMTNNIKGVLEDFLKFWDEVTEKQEVVLSVDMKTAKRLMLHVIPKYLEKKAIKKIKK